MADPDYRVEVAVSGHVYDVTFGDVPARPTVVLPLTVGWSIPEAVDFFPTQANPTSGSFGIAVDDLGDLADVMLGDPVALTMWTPAAAVDPWLETDVDALCVTQLESDTRTRTLTVYFGEASWLLQEMVVGLVDWPLESVLDRVTRICAEAGLTLNDAVLGLSSTGTLAARSASPTNALDALRSALKDDADEQTGPDESVYGRVVYFYSPATSTLTLASFERRPSDWPGTLAADGQSIERRPGEPGALDGCAVQTSGKWARLGIDRPTYVIVDGTTFGDPAMPGAVPYVRNTSYVDVFPDNSGTATARDTLGESLLPDDVTLDKWRTDAIRHLTYLEPDPAAGWFESWRRVRLVIVEPIAASLTPDGRTWIAGTLTAARLTIPPGGRFYTDLSLRPDLVPAPFDLIAGIYTIADFPPALTIGGIAADLTFRDFRTLGA